ncbi:MAG: molybdopterin-dependent oxidoreductase [Phycisphaeraceae bacterium]|nr:molybdopterin-dependent oxidoreductase [Phycisphaeraceae bacterium]
MPTITINGKQCEFTSGKTILQVALENSVEIPYYCYHPGLSIVASCRICLGEVWAPNPRNDNKLEPMPKLVPTCQVAAGDGQVVYTDSPKAVKNQKAVMEYLLINHPLDCPVCDQSGECFLQDYSYFYGRGVSRFEEDKIKQPKKDLGPNVLLYSDRCIMCSRCVRFTREVSGTAELTVEGRGAKEQIDVFPGKALNNELASNVVDLCPVGALLDKDFLFAQRVWFLKSTPSIDGITSSGDNIFLEHNEGRVYRVKPRDNEAINRWWITDEVRYGWKFIHREDRLSTPMRREHGVLMEATFAAALADASKILHECRSSGKKAAIVVSPMLASEEAQCFAALADAIPGDVALAVGPVPVMGEDRVYPKGAKPAHEGGSGFVVRAEKCPNSRGVRRVLEANSGGAKVLAFEDFLSRAQSGEFGAVVLTGNYPSDWATPEIVRAFDRAKGDRAKLILIDTLPTRLADHADVLLPGATWAEKAGSFENATHVVQPFEQAIPVREGARVDGQIALDLAAGVRGEERSIYDAPTIREQMAHSGVEPLRVFAGVSVAKTRVLNETDMALVDL